MRLEYFQMLDRIVDVDVGERRIRTARTIPKANEEPGVRRPFPGYPLMPGVLLIECMAQTTDELYSALANFDIMPILAGVKEAMMRSAVFPGDELRIRGPCGYHEGSGFTVAEVKGRRQGKAVCDAQITYRMLPYPNPQFRQAIRDWAERLQFPFKEPVKGKRTPRGVDHRRRAVDVVSARDWRRIGKASSAAIHRLTTTRPSRPISCIRCRR